MIAVLPPRLRRAVSAYTGIVRSVEECLPANDGPGLFQAVCEVGDGSGVVGSTLAHLSGVGGMGRTRRAAATAAVGEALERYSATYVPEDRLVFGSARELGDVAVAPERFVLFSESQHETPRFRFRRFGADTRVAWVPGRDLRAGRPVLLPAELVFLGNVRAVGQAPIGYSTSSGLACGENWYETVFRGLCELLERDAFMIVWANRLTLPRLHVGEGTSASAVERTYFSPTGMRYSAVDLSPFHGLPSVLGVVRAPAGMIGALGVGAGTAATIDEAWEKAISEAFAARSAGVKLSLLHPEPEHDGGSAATPITTFDGHIRYHADPARAGSSRFLDASEQSLPAASIGRLEGATPGERIAALCDRVEAAGSSAYAADVTSPDVAELGLTVARVIAPELCPLDVAHTARFLGGRRLYEAAAAIGLRSGVLREADVNPDPHPFP